MPALYPDRIVTIRGGADNVSEAEHAISLRLREAYDKELSMPMPMVSGSVLTLHGVYWFCCN